MRTRSLMGLLGVFAVFFLTEASFGQVAVIQTPPPIILHPPRTRPSLIEMSMHTNVLGLQREIFARQWEADRVIRDTEDDCIAGWRQADKEFMRAKSERSGNRCYQERWADFTKPVYRQRLPPESETETRTPAPPSEPAELPEPSIPDDGVALIRKALEDHRKKTPDPTFDSWSEDKREVYARAWNQEENLVVEGEKTGIVLTP